MKLFKFMLPVLMALGLFSAAYGVPTPSQDGSRFDEELNERDWEVLHDFVNSKRTIDIKEKANNLTISGDVRFEWRHMNEKINGFRCRGGDASTVGGKNARPDDFVFYEEQIAQDPALIKEFKTPLPISRNDFDVECNLYFDYVSDRTWAVAQLQFDDSAGVDDEEDSCSVDPGGYHGSGKCDDICLKRAYFGYNLYNCGPARLDIEVGRRKLYNVFDSKIEFLSRFDGILLKYSNSWEVANWYWEVAGFVVDERVNHFAWATEIGFLNIMDSGFDFKYSLIDWQKHGKGRCFIGTNHHGKPEFIRNPKAFNAIVSQWLVYYHLNPELLCMPAYFYGAFLMNHAQHHFTKHHKHHKKHKIRDNLGWYAGFTLGEVDKEGDWAIDIEYQVVQAFAIPDGDVSGISNNNVYDNSITGPYNRGNTNYEGWKFEALYAITDDLSVDAIIEWSKEYEKRIGGKNHYSKFELEAIYAF